VAYNERHISLQFRLEDRAEGRRLTFSAQRQRIEDSTTRIYKILQLQEEKSAFRRTAKIKRTMGLDRDWQSTRIRKRNQIQETMVETKRNEAINQIAVGGYVRATKPAAVNIFSVVDTEKRN